MDPEERLELIKLVASHEDWKVVLAVGEVILANTYPERIFPGISISGDPGPKYIVALREAIKNLKATA